MRGFEPPISGPPDQHFNRTKLHPECLANILFFLNIQTNAYRKNILTFIQLSYSSKNQNDNLGHALSYTILF